VTDAAASPRKTQTQTKAQTQSHPLDGRRILLGVTGGIAAYKSPAIVSALVQHGASVRVVMTEAAGRFTTETTMRSLSGQSVISSIWRADDRPDSQHIGLARWCELMLIAPATAHCLGALANGLCDDAVTLAATALPAATPLLVAPAMNADMWANPAVQRNVQRLADWPNLTTVGPESGWQACRTVGAGRMSEPAVIVERVRELLGA